MRDQIRAKLAQMKRVEAKEASVSVSVRELALALRDAFGGMNVSGESAVVTVEDPEGRSAFPLGAYLQYANDQLLAVWNPTGAIIRGQLGEAWARKHKYQAMRLETCPLPWLQRLLTQEVVASLIQSIGGDMDGREARVDAVMAEARALLSAESAQNDAEMTDSLTASGDENLSRLWQDAVDATRTDSADALTRCSRFLEAVCAKILRERGEELPADKSMGPLVKACQKSLTWPDAKEAEADVRQLLGGIQSICNGVGALRTHFGTAHGASSHLPPLDPGYAVFVKQATVAAATFLLDRHQASAPTARADPDPR
ncbi:abortive infection family protein [Burkholderia stagnalis]|uniref:abortive infection family protein n=1 Tax=Burkholderia stagnalis TaxID=1503054 RepID=UPI00075E5658|nr:abortive infection family protein [Burkholderia stagnalis]KVL93094.1 hypothetical protein WT03_19000 [Burkholderia stagnalis]KVL94791.1 hypothetical protein WT02_18170 [Burkholderia stagnalis]KVM13124.1 hypothetical protein WT04_11490 [Burkholderia stagnalis]